jgi:phosphoglycerol transferase MdoB-like AlkP superfamily enzyme
MPHMSVFPKERLKSEADVFIGPCFTVIACWTFKNLYLSAVVDSNIFPNVLGRLASDALCPALSLLFLSRRSALIRVFISLVITLWYLIDTAFIFIINNRLTPAHIVEYWKAMDLYLPVVEHYWYLLLILPALFFPLPNFGMYKPRRARFIIAFCAILLSCIVDRAGYLRYGTYALNPLRNLASLDVSGTSLTTYSNLDISYYRDQMKSIRYPPFPPQPPDVLLIMVEGFSASYSSYYGDTTSSMTPRLDTWAKRGVVFKEFIANGDSTDMGVVATLAGTYPFRRHGDYRSLYNALTNAPAPLNQFREAGYTLVRLDGAPIAFPKFFSALGFSIIKGPESDNADATTAWLPDSQVYRHVLDLLSSPHKDPLFIVVSTMSTHVPYFPLRGEGGSGESGAWAYADNTLDTLLTQLAQQNLLSSTLVAITGDHHARRAITPEERELYGDSAENRVPLILLGWRVVPRIEYSPLQQADLLPNLITSVTAAPTFSRPIIAVNRLSRRESLISSLDSFTLLKPEEHLKKGYEGYAIGNQIVWLEEPSSGERENAERYIHAARIPTQASHGSSHQHCPRTTDLIPSTHTHGVSVTLKAPADQRIIDWTKYPPNRYSSKIVPEINFPFIDQGQLGQRRFFAARFLTSLSMPLAGEYMLRFEYDDGLCAYSNGRLIINDWADGEVRLKDVPISAHAGQVVSLDIRYLQLEFDGFMRLQWRTPGKREWEIIPQGSLYLPNFAR